MLETLKNIADGVYPFTMPGHKRNPRFLYACPDITEVSGADDLHHPFGIIKDSQENAAELFGALHTLYLTGGSTTAILAAVFAVTEVGDTLLIARNSHKSVYNAALINHLKTEYIIPKYNGELGVFGEVSVNTVREALQKTKARAVIITSPTYEGIVSDIKRIADEVHRAGALLIVDAAHGAHLGFSEHFLPSARHLGADIVIESAHKTLPCLTGAALLHICTNRVSYEEIKSAFSIFQSSSPSYPILSSIDKAVSVIKNDGKSLFSDLSHNLKEFYEIPLLNLSVYRAENHDITKILIVCKNTDITGFELKKRLLTEHKIECEAAQPDFVLCMTSVADTKDGFKRLFEGLCEIDKTLHKTDRRNTAFKLPLPKVKMTLNKAYKTESEVTALFEAKGKISGNYIYMYPPGSPIVAPGEEITDELVDLILSFKAHGADIYTENGALEHIKILKTE